MPSLIHRELFGCDCGSCATPIFLRECCSFWNWVAIGFELMLLLLFLYWGWNHVYLRRKIKTPPANPTIKSALEAEP